MKSIRFNRLCRALILPAVLLACSANAQPFILTNNAPRAIPRRPNIILIVADGLGYGDLSCYGQTKFQTPNLDRLAAEGVRFTNYYAGATASLPARAALLLGKNPARLRQRAPGDFPLSANEITVAQVLKNSGYRTGFIGQWNFGDENSAGAPWKKGFDEFAGYFDAKDATNFYADFMWRYSPQSIYDPTNRQWAVFTGKETLYQNADNKKGQYVPDVFTKAALNFARINLPDQFNHYRPFFLLLNCPIPGGGKGAVPTDAPFSEENWPQPEKNRAAMIARLDGYVGQLLEQLANIRQDSNTVIFFTSDTIAKNGGGVAPDFFHSNISSNDLRVPMILHWPGGISAGRVSDFKCSANDFLPTAADIAFAKPPQKIDGHSILPALTPK